MEEASGPAGSARVTRATRQSASLDKGSKRDIVLEEENVQPSKRRGRPKKADDGEVGPSKTKPGTETRVAAGVLTGLGQQRSKSGSRKGEKDSSKSESLTPVPWKTKRRRSVMAIYQGTPGPSADQHGPPEKPLEDRQAEPAHQQQNAAATADAQAQLADPNEKAASTADHQEEADAEDRGTAGNAAPCADGAAAVEASHKIDKAAPANIQDDARNRAAPTEVPSAAVEDAHDEQATALSPSAATEGPAEKAAATEDAAAAMEDAPSAAVEDAGDAPDEPAPTELPSAAMETARDEAAPTEAPAAAMQDAGDDAAPTQTTRAAMEDAHDEAEAPPATELDEEAAAVEEDSIADTQQGPADEDVLDDQHQSAETFNMVAAVWQAVEGLLPTVADSVSTEHAVAAAPAMQQQNASGQDILETGPVSEEADKVYISTMLLLARACTILGRTKLFCFAGSPEKSSSS